MKIKIDEIKIKFRILDQQKLKAIFKLDLGDFVVTGFRIQESEHENSRGQKLWITPPSYQDRSVGRFHPIFYIPNKELWGKLEEYIWDEYERQSDEHYKKSYGIKLEDT